MRRKKNTKKNIKLVVLHEAPLAVCNIPKSIKYIEDLREIQTQTVPGVYFLCNDNEVVYIGQSENPMARIDNHSRGNKKFNRIFFLSVMPSDLDTVEGMLIRIIKPKYNGGENRKRNDSVLNAPHGCKDKNEMIEKYGLQNFTA